MKIISNQLKYINLNKENKSKLEALLEKVASEGDLEIYGLNIKTNQNPIVIEIIIRKTNGDDISLDDCALFNTPASDEIEKSKNLHFMDVNKKTTIIFFFN